MWKALDLAVTYDFEHWHFILHAPFVHEIQCMNDTKELLVCTILQFLIWHLVRRLYLYHL